MKFILINDSYAFLKIEDILSFLINLQLTLKVQRIKGILVGGKLCKN